MPECYIRGSTIKYLRIPDEVIDMVKEETIVKNKVRTDIKGGRGGQSQRNRPAARGKDIGTVDLKDMLLRLNSCHR